MFYSELHSYVHTSVLLLYPILKQKGICVRMYMQQPLPNYTNKYLFVLRMYMIYKYQSLY